MPDISLKWRLFRFFLVLGLLPQILISYFSISAYTRSLEKTCNENVNQLLEQVVEQTNTRYRSLEKELSVLAAQSYIQLAFQQYSIEQRFRLINERLELFCSTTSAFNHISLCFLNGERLVGTEHDATEGIWRDFEKKAIGGFDSNPDFSRLLKVGQGVYLVLFKPIYSFREPSRIVGVIVGYIPVSELTLFLERIDLGQNTHKTIVSNLPDQIVIFKTGDTDKIRSMMRTYSAFVTIPDWQIKVDIEEAELLAEVHDLKMKNMLFIALCILTALAVSFIFSQRFTRPFKKIIAGTQIFAKGSFQHRINIDTGHEARLMAKAFNQMADEINDRQNELNRASRMASLGIMTAGIAHEIKNPLTGIKSSSQVINRIFEQGQLKTLDSEMIAIKTQDIDVVSDLSNDIAGEVDRLAKVLNDLLDFAKPKSACMVDTQLADIIARAKSIVRWEFKKKRVKLNSSVSPVDICVDPDQLLQVLINLLLNALEAVSKDSGSVEISSGQSQKGDVVLKIFDNGIGIAEDKLDHIFDPFFSLRDHGVGLGLSVVYNLLKQNNATIDVTSSPGKGTAMKITFKRLNKE